MDRILKVEDLRVYYKTVYGDYKVVDGVSFDVYSNEIFGIAGESGCGKSTLVEAILRLIKPPGYIKSGRVFFKGYDLLNMPNSELRRIRWKEISYVPQGAMNSLNPVLRIEDQMVDAILAKEEMPREEARKMVLKALNEVSLPAEVAKMYPHELSGGMKQRVIIAMATLLKPTLLVADEPVTALDVIVQRSIIELLRELKKRYNLSIIFVAHDLAAHAELVDRLMVMYAGKIMEIGSVYDVFLDPLHPYTRLLVAAVPSLKKKSVKGIPGLAPSPLNWPSGCRFHPRCPYAMPICSKEEPQLKKVGNGRYVACHQ